MDLKSENSLKPSQDLCEATLRWENPIGPVVIEILGFRQKDLNTLYNEIKDNCDLLSFINIVKYQILYWTEIWHDGSF